MARLIIGATTLVAALAHAPATGAHTGSHAAAALAVTDTKPGTHACTGRSVKLRATECTAWHMPCWQWRSLGDVPLPRGLSP